jgi:hypothetical protein
LLSVLAHKSAHLPPNDFPACEFTRFQNSLKLPKCEPLKYGEHFLSINDFPSFAMCMITPEVRAYFSANLKKGEICREFRVVRFFLD